MFRILGNDRHNGLIIWRYKAQCSLLHGKQQFRLSGLHLQLCLDAFALLLSPCTLQYLHCWLIQLKAVLSAGLHLHWALAPITTSTLIHPCLLVSLDLSLWILIALFCLCLLRLAHCMRYYSDLLSFCSRIWHVIHFVGIPCHPEGFIHGHGGESPTQDLSFRSLDCLHPTTWWWWWSFWSESPIWQSCFQCQQHEEWHQEIGMVFLPLWKHVYDQSIIEAQADNQPRCFGSRVICFGESGGHHHPRDLQISSHKVPWAHCIIVQSVYWREIKFRHSGMCFLSSHYLWSQLKFIFFWLSSSMLYSKAAWVL